MIYRYSWLIFIAMGILITGSPVSSSGQEVNADSVEGVPGEYVRHFFGAVHLKEEYHEYANKIGFKWGRQGAKWDIIEPENNQYEFESYDRLIGSAGKHNLEILTVLSHSALWASSAPDGVDNRDKYPPKESHIGEWREYVEQIVTRYPDVEYFEVWNEPNIDWFLRSEENYKAYIDRILIPAAEVIHKHNRKVVGLSFTTEWPLDSWPPKQRPRNHSENVSSNIKAMERWLNYRDAWKHVDILSIHYTHGDAEKHGEAHAENMMPFYEYLHENWIEPGKLEGVWNTEEGFAGVEAGKQGFVALDRWERPPLEQWAARYTLPVLHWALQKNWNDRDRYKVFWYHMPDGTHPRNLLRPGTGNSLELSQTAKALKVIIDEFTGAERIGAYDGEVEVGFGLESSDTTAINYFAPYRFKNYTFTVDEELFIAAWLDLSGIKQFGQPVQIRLKGVEAESSFEVYRVDYITGEKNRLQQVRRMDDGSLFVEIPPINDPILFLRLGRDGM